MAKACSDESHVDISSHGLDVVASVSLGQAEQSVSYLPCFGLHHLRGAAELRYTCVEDFFHTLARQICRGLDAWAKAASIRKARPNVTVAWAPHDSGPDRLAGVMHACTPPISASLTCDLVQAVQYSGTLHQPCPEASCRPWPYVTT